MSTDVQSDNVGAAKSGDYGSTHSEGFTVGGYLSDDSHSSQGEDRRHVSDVLRMKCRLKFFFLSPVEKWRVKRQLPYKLIAQVLKIVLVTAQAISWEYDMALIGCNFCQLDERFQISDYIWDNRVVLSRAFVMGLGDSAEVDPYPPSFPPQAIFTKARFHEYIDHAAKVYSNLGDGTLGTLMHDRNHSIILPLKFCVKKMKDGHLWDGNSSYAFNGRMETVCVSIPFKDLEDNDFNSSEWLMERNMSINFIALHRANLTFSLNTINVHSAVTYGTSECYRFYLSLDFDNVKHSGRILVKLKVDQVQFECEGEYISSGPYLHQAVLDTLNVAVMLLCLTSFILCSRAVYRAQLLRNEADKFFRNKFGSSLSPNDRMEFVNLWYVMIIVNDILIIIGSGIQLGAYFEIVMLTLKRATPNLMRFLLCALIIYAGFTFCGWLVLGPYHFKFRDLMTTSETLFSLINGDDMFATFSAMSLSSVSLWWFSRIYLYIFISLFIYIVLSLFIAVIMDAYESIKEYMSDEEPSSPLHEFMEGEPFVMDLMDETIHRQTTWQLLTASFRDTSLDERTPLIHSNLNNNEPVPPKWTGYREIIPEKQLQEYKDLKQFGNPKIPVIPISKLDGRRQ